MTTGCVARFIQLGDRHLQNPRLARRTFDVWRHCHCQRMVSVGARRNGRVRPSHPGRRFALTPVMAGCWFSSITQATAQIVPTTDTENRERLSRLKGFWQGPNYVRRDCDRSFRANRAGYGPLWLGLDSDRYGVRRRRSRNRTRHDRSDFRCSIRALGACGSGTNWQAKGPLDRYCARRATNGSTRLARRAGRYAARTLAANSTTLTAR
jgi:hypothetical protein